MTRRGAWPAGERFPASVRWLLAYIDPGHATDTELYSWGAAHGPLWDALRKKGQLRLKMPPWTGRRGCLKHGRRRTQGQAMKGLTPRQ